MNLRNIGRYIANNKLNVASKVAGGATAGMILYAAHRAGLRTSAENIKIQTAEQLTSDFQKSRRMETRNEITSKLKDEYFRGTADWNFPEKIHGFTGYMGGLFQQAAYNFVPATLATGALISKKYAKFFGAGLGLYGLKYLICDVMDVGKVNHLKGPY